MSHVAFLVEPSYGHVVPTLSLAAELVRRGFRVTYPTTEFFAEKIAMACNAQPVIYRPPEARLEVWRKGQRADGTFSLEGDEMRQFLMDANRDLNLETSSQLSALYRNDPPRLLVHDKWLSLAAQALAAQWQVPRVLFLPGIPLYGLEECKLGLVSLPRFFQRDAGALDDRYVFMGFPARNRKEFFEPWRGERRMEKLILVSATTGLLPQVEFFRNMIQALEGYSAFQVVLSIGRDVDSEALGSLPANFEINTSVANFELLEHASLFIGQGGQGVTLEALYWGVPQLAIPPAPFHKGIADRMVELGGGISLRPAEASSERIRSRVSSLLSDSQLQSRLRDLQQMMRVDEVSRAATLLSDLA